MNSSSRSERDEASSSPDIGDILEQHRWIVESLAAKFAAGDESLQEDLEQEGSLALVLFVEEFEPGPKSFASLAYDRVKSRMINHLRDIQDPSDTDLRLGLPASKDDREGEITNPFSLEEVLADEAPSPEDALLRKERETLVREVVESLPSRERRVVELVMFEDYTHEQVSQLLGVSRVMITKIFGEALDKVRIRLGKAL